MDSSILRFIAVFYHVIILCDATKLMDSGGHKGPEEYWKEHIGEHAKMPKAITDSLNNGKNQHNGGQMDGNSMVRFKNYVIPKEKDKNADTKVNKETGADANGEASMTTSENHGSSSSDKGSGQKNKNGAASIDASGSHASLGSVQASNQGSSQVSRGLSQIERHESSEVSKEPLEKGSSQPPNLSKDISQSSEDEASKYLLSQKSNAPNNFVAPVSSPIRIEALYPNKVEYLAILDKSESRQSLNSNENSSPAWRRLSQIIRHASHEVSKEPLVKASSQPPTLSEDFSQFSEDEASKYLLSQAPNQKSSTSKNFGAPTSSPISIEALSRDNVVDPSIMDKSGSYASLDSIQDSNQDSNQIWRKLSQITRHASREVSKEPLDKAASQPPTLSEDFSQFSEDEASKYLLSQAPSQKSSTSKNFGGLTSSPISIEALSRDNVVDPSIMDKSGSYASLDSIQDSNQDSNQIWRKLSQITRHASREVSKEPLDKAASQPPTLSEDFSQFSESEASNYPLSQAPSPKSSIPKDFETPIGAPISSTNAFSPSDIKEPSISDKSEGHASSGSSQGFGRGLSQIIRQTSSEVSKEPLEKPLSQSPNLSQDFSQSSKDETQSPSPVGSPISIRAVYPNSIDNSPRSLKEATASIKDSIASLFFAEADLSLGKNMNLHLTKSTNGATFLPRDMINELPFSLASFAESLLNLDLQTDWEQALIMKETLEYCEDNEGENKRCTTSLESMVDFATTMVGKQVEAISMNIDKDMKMEFEVQNIKKLPRIPKGVTCHKIPFPYAVFYCETIEDITVFVPTLVGTDGTAINAPAICHDDTDSWDHNHWVFENLHAQPGSGPICHFLLDDDVLWIPQYVNPLLTAVE